MTPPKRCPWLDLSKPDYVAYHDREWGVPVHDDRKAFEFLVLESAQAGLSWYSVLRRREAYRRVFAGFDPNAVAAFGPKDVERLLADPGIIRNRKKIEAAIGNARAFLAVQSERGSFDAYIWSFVSGRPIVNAPRTFEEIPATSLEGDRLCADLRERGFRFVGPKIVYAHMQATGLVNDHVVGCFRRREILAELEGGAER